MDKNSCALCHSERLSPVFRDNGYDQKPYDIVQCQQCQFMFIDPMPSNDDLSKIYATYYGDGSHEDETKKHLDFRKNVFDDLLQKLEKVKKPGATILDMGCGNGEFLTRAREKDWIGEGIEISKRAVDYAVNKRNLQVRQAENLDQLPYDNESFDVVTLLDVLEHLKNPTQILREARRVLKPDGTLWLRVPNTPFQLKKAKIQRLRFGKNFTTMATPLHLNHFDKNSIKKVVESAGFQLRALGPGAADGLGHILRLKQTYFYMAKLISAFIHLELGNILEVQAEKS